MDENWRPLLPTLVEAYLRRGHEGADSEGSVSEGSQEGTPDLSPFTIDVYDMHTLEARVEIPRREDQTTAEALVAAGYLGNTPIAPSIAISLKTLEMLRSIRLFQASFSMEAFTKLLCHLYTVSPLIYRHDSISHGIQIPYDPHLRSMISDAFDIYLEILLRVDERVMSALGRDAPDWRAVNSCPACAYKVREFDPLAHDS